MDKSSRLDIPRDVQATSWDHWNLKGARGTATTSAPSLRQAQALGRRVESLGRRDLTIIDVGCGNGWICDRLQPYGRVTGVDFSASSIREASARLPGVTFHAGDLFEIELPERSFDLVVTLEVLAHVADQSAFMQRIARLLKPEGYVFLATQNRPVLERWSEVGAPMPGTIRQWVDVRCLRGLMEPHFEGLEIESVHPVGDRGLLRIVNSVKLNAVLGRVVPAAAIERLKERAMLGHTLLAWGRRSKV